MGSGVVQFGDNIIRKDASGNSYIGGPANFTKVEADGTVQFNGDAIVWDDLRVTVNQVKVPAAKYPAWTAYSAGLLLGYLYQAVEGNEEEVYFVVQLPHSYKEGSDITPHVHWVGNENATDASEIVRWGLEYEWINMDGSFSATTTIWVDATIEDDEGDKHFLNSFAAIDGTGKTISSVLICRLFRNSSHENDTYDSGTALALLIDVDIHFELDTVGSRAILTK